LKCAICGKQYLMHIYRSKTSKYCSRKCWNERAKIKKCVNCGKEFTYKNSFGKFYCSTECCYKHRVGKNAPAYKDGKSMERERARKSVELSKWRKKVFKRDSYKCVLCDSDSFLNAHHIVPFSENKTLALCICNGITLCEKCHGKIHGKDFSKRRKKKCPICGKKTTGRGKNSMCKSCAITLWHSSKKKK
jgi:5-methylcytosine-specific restriction endonuclease McrA